MPIYKQTTEITNIDDLLSSVERDIEEVYFGDKNIFTVWATYDGTLPATYSANGSALVDYRVYGSAGGVGDKTENLFDPKATDTNNGYTLLRYLLPDGTESSGASSAYYFITEYTLIQSGAETLSLIKNSSSSGTAICFYDANKTYISGVSNQSNPHGVVSVPAGAVYYRSSIERGKANIAMVVEGSTAPVEYVPYGYEVPMKISHKLALTSDDFRNGGYLIANGKFSYFQFYLCTQKRPLESSTLNVYAKLGKKTNAICITYYSGDTYLGYQMNQNYNDYEAHISSEAPEGATEYALSIGRYNGENIYPSDIEAFDISWLMATPPIYIGAPLEEDEYVDYATGKIYRRTENLFDKDDISRQISNVIFYQGAISNTMPQYPNGFVIFIPVSAGEQYTFKKIGATGYGNTPLSSCFTIGTPKLNVSYRINGATTYLEHQLNTFTRTAPTGANWMCVEIAQKEQLNDDIVIVKGSTAPSTYIPYLQSTDPPVPIPALPTVDGTNIVDYAGQSVAVPSRFYAKYRKEGFK